MKRVLSILLALAMVVTLVPGFTVASASVTDGVLTESDLVNDDVKLGKGFNVLAGKQLLKENVSINAIFADPSVLAPRVSSASRTEFYYTYINDANSFLKNQSAKLNMDIDAEAQISLVSVEASVKYGLDTSSSSFDAEQKEYIALSALASRKKYYYQSTGADAIKALWNTEGALSEGFKEEISMLQTDEDIAAFFAKYGTHIITAYTVGGEACYTYSGEKVEAAESMSVDENISVSAGVSVGAFGSVKASVDLANHVDSSGTSSTTDVSAYGYQKGGVGIPFKETDITAWEQTITDSTMEILVNDSLQMIPIWELLAQEGQADLRARLKNYFEKQLGTGYTGVDNLMGKTDYSDYTFITNARELDEIRNDLSGKYVLLCDIDLSAYDQWVPVGSSGEEPFSGILDGNGNTITGLRVTEAVNGAAGLFGYIGSLGEVRNLTLRGTVEVDTADVGYVGGIAGYSNGIIRNCRNLVSVNGTLSADTSAVEGQGENTWFDTNRADIQAAKSTAATVATEGAVYDTFPLKLTGSAENITISVPDSGRVAYIILQDAQITGTISSVSGNTRPVCIISTGSGNAFAAPNDAIAINTPNAGVYITGDAPLTVTGGNGADGANGAAVSGTTGSNGKNGANGGHGKNGATGMIAGKLVIDIVSVSISGGNGGNGGHASNGTNGSDISGTCKSNYGTSGSCRGATGGNGGNGGIGGNGGNGAVPVSVGSILTYGDSNVVLHYGANGNGGNGGIGGNGGRGQNGADGWCVAGIEPGHSAGHGGAGGAGGDGGSAGVVTLIDYGEIATLFHRSNIIIEKTHIFSGVGGNGGAGGKGGAGGTGGAEIHNWFYDIGQHPGVAGNGGNGGKGGDGGDGGAGYRFGAGADAGTGGAAGSRGKTKDNCGRNGTPGASGKIGIAGAVTITDSTTSKAVLVTNAKRYSVYTTAASREDIDAQLNGGELVSVGSDKEQLLLEKLLAQASGSKYWIGLYRNSDKGFNIFDWADGTTLRIQEDTFGSDAVASLIGGSNEEICEAFSNWAPGQPDNANSNEKYIYMDAIGAWYDTVADDSTIDGYIVEETLVQESTNSKDKNILFVGGICGFADVESEISGCINDGTVNGKATSEEYGVTANSGGIAGINHGSLQNCVNSGTVEAISISNSFTEYSDACAAQITNAGGSGMAANCYSEIEPVAYAVSGSGLSNPSTVKDAAAAVDLVQQLEALWRNDCLRITAVDSEKTVYAYGDVFDKNSIRVTYNGTAISRFKVNYYFKNGASSANVVISYKDAVRILPVKLVELEIVSFEVTEAKQSYYFNETFQTDDLVATLCYNTGLRKAFKADDPQITVSSPDMTRLGKQVITVTYCEDSIQLQCTYEVEVLPAVLEGSVHIDGTAAYGQTLTVNLSGITTENAIYTVIWYNDEAQPLSTAKSITVTESMIDRPITVVVTGIGYYQGTLTSKAVVPVRLDVAAPDAPAVSRVTDTTVELQLIAGAEYRCGDGAWQTSNVFTGLKPDTQYSFYVRYAQTGTTNASSPSLPVHVTTLQGEEPGMIGDVTGDGKVNMKDWKIVYDYITEAQELTEHQLSRADVTGDGKVNMKDWSRLYDHITEVNPL